MKTAKWTKRIAALMLVLLCAGATLPSKAAQTEDVTQQVLANFEKLAEIPRTSGHEEAVGEYLLTWAKAQGFSPVRDKTGNVIFDVPATSGYE